jgi:hypothetical protein
MRLFPPPRRADWPNASNGTTRPSTAVGWIGPNPNSGSSQSQCQDRRIPDKETLIKEVAAWEERRNKHHNKADWQFTTDNARIKLKRALPNVMNDSGH